MAFLLGMSDKVKGQRFELTKDVTTIGRVEGNDIVVEDETISSKHCRIEKQDDSYKLIDLDSTNGTMVNMETVTEKELQPKNVVQFGGIEFVFDGEELKSASSRILAESQVISSDSPKRTGPPDSFSSVSPFGPRMKKRKNTWALVLLIIGVLALGGVGFLVYKLVF